MALGLFGTVEEPSYAQRLAAALRSQDRDKYHQVLGEFVSQFAVVEAEMQAALRHFAKVRPGIAKAIFSGTKTEVAASYIKRILEVKPLKSKKRQAALLEALKQLKAINDARNLILHFGGRQQPDNVWLVTNASAAHTARSLKEMNVTTAMLYGMTADLIKIGMLLGSFDTPISKPFRRILNRVLNAAWLYTRPEQEKKGRGRKAARKARRKSKPRQRPPSRQ